MVQEELLEENGQLIFNKGNYCGGKSQCNGIFYINASGDPLIKVAMGKYPVEEWFGVLVHEYCHFLQWRRNSKVWQEFNKNEIKFETLFAEPQKNKKAIKDLINLELDCEKKAVKFIKTQELINLEKYCICANAVLFKYVYMYHYHKWPTCSKKYSLVLQASPKNLLLNSDRYINNYMNIISMYS